MSTAAATPQIEGLPPGAEVRQIGGSLPKESAPSQGGAIEGLPAGAEIHPIAPPPQPSSLSGPTGPSVTYNRDPEAEQRGVGGAIIGWMDDTLQGLKHIPELFIPKEGEKDEQFIAGKIGTPGGLAVYKVGKALLSQLAQAKAERDRVAAQGEGAAGKTLTTLENYPLLGPLTNMAEHHDVSGALTRGLLDYFSFKGPGEAAKAGEAGLAKVAPTTARIGGTEVPVLASQEGSTAGRLAEGASKATGSAGEHQLGKFAEGQQAAGKQALGGVASQAAEKGIQSTLAPGKALPRSKSFGEAAERLRAEAKPQFEALDKATNGEFSKLQDERSQTIKAMRNPNLSYGDWEKLSAQMDGIETREEAMIGKQAQGPLAGARKVWKQAAAMDKIDAAIRSSMSGIPEGTMPLKTARGRAVAQQAEKINGAGLLKRFNNLDQKGVLDTALAGNKQHIADMKNLASLLQTGKNAAQADMVIRGVRALVHVPTAFASEGASYVLGKVLTSPKAAKVLSDGLKSGANAGTVTYAVSKVLHDEEQKIDDF